MQARLAGPGQTHSPSRTRCTASVQHCSAPKQFTGPLARLYIRSQSARSAPHRLPANESRGGAGRGQRAACTRAGRAARVIGGASRGSRAGRAPTAGTPVTGWAAAPCPGRSSAASGMEPAANFRPGEAPVILQLQLQPVRWAPCRALPSHASEALLQSLSRLMQCKKADAYQSHGERCDAKDERGSKGDCKKGGGPRRA